MMGNYSEEYATFNASPIAIIQSPQISERENETRSKSGWGEEAERATKRRRDERVFLQEEEEEETYSVGFVQI